MLSVSVEKLQLLDFLARLEYHNLSLFVCYGKAWYGMLWCGVVWNGLVLFAIAWYGIV